MDLIKAQQLAEKLIHKHELDIKGWTFAYDNAKRRFGSCNYRLKKITLSKSLTQLNDMNHVKNTILHEIAHALCPGQKHNYIWRTKAIEIGCDGNRCYDSKMVEAPESKYIASCVGCGKKFKSHRIRKRSYSCKNCSGGGYNPKYKLEFKLNPVFDKGFSSASV